MTSDEMPSAKSGVRKRDDEIKSYRCKNLIAVLEFPSDFKNIGTVIRNVNALGVEKTYIIDPRRSLPEDWQDMRETKLVLSRLRSGLPTHLGSLSFEGQGAFAT